MPSWANGRRNPPARRGRIGVGTWLFLGLLLAAFALFGLTPEPPVGKGSLLSGTVERVTDGDTIEIAGQRIRLTGLDAPEWDQTCGTSSGGIWDCGLAAATRMRELARGRVLTCMPEGHDRYARLLALCRDGETDVAEALVGEGLAVSTGRYGAAESAARAARRGLWQGDFVAPAQWRASKAAGEGQSGGNPSRFERFVTWLLGLFAS